MIIKVDVFALSWPVIINIMDTIQVTPASLTRFRTTLFITSPTFFHHDFDSNHHCLMMIFLQCKLVFLLILSKLPLMRSWLDSYKLNPHIKDKIAALNFTTTNHFISCNPREEARTATVFRMRGDKLIDTADQQ